MISLPPNGPAALPERINRLHDLAYNLWWTWSKPARQVFAQLHPVLWDLTEHNPVLFLHRIDQDRLDLASSNPAYLTQYDKVVASFDAMLAMPEEEMWLGRNRPQLTGKSLAYFSAEFGIHRALPIYSGGLGVLAGDHIKEASDIGIPLTAISLLYRQGYLRQRIDSEGWQHDVPGDLDPNAEPVMQVFEDDGTPVFIEINLGHAVSSLRLAVWHVQVGRVPLYLLDSDVEGNPDWTRKLSSRLYGGDAEHRLRQEIILGIGGVRLLRKLGIDPVYWHANEGHAALHLLERAREIVATGKTFGEAKEQVRAATVFTTHTPVPAGHDIYSAEMMDSYFSQYWPQLDLEREAFLALGVHGEQTGFNFTALSLRLAGHVNGVSEKHGEVSREMWHDLWPGKSIGETPIISITNGVHLRTWISPEMRRVYENYLPRRWRDSQESEFVWELIMNIPDEEFWNAHQVGKQALIDEMDERVRRRYVEGQFDAWQVLSSGPFQNANVLTLGFARRFATYKRATLVLQDIDRLAKILNNPDYPMQLIFAGKAHPADEGGKRLIQEIYTRARDPRLGGRVAFVEDYEMGLANLMVAGVDVWLNNPIFPLEASGTSGMKASANGVPNCSILDGWWIEGHREGDTNGWGLKSSILTGADRDTEDANTIYEVLENKIVPLYYHREADGVPHDWIQVAKEAIRTIAPQFSARRMVIEYIDKLYMQAAGVEGGEHPTARKS